MRAYDFGAPYAALFARCTPRQRRLLGDLGHDFRPGDFFYAPEDQEALMTGARATLPSILARADPGNQAHLSS